MAQRDLDAALQLLADRAQYITGASGAAIALRRDGLNDMLCRASTGSNAPELGALLSAEYGLSGESVRTRRPLRCDDAERDARVNREVCRQLGIASVVVMPVVNDDEVLGVFELFSGKTNAFGERDLSAVQRLSEMVETAVRLARARQKLQERWKAAEAMVEVTVEEDFLDGDILEVDVVEPAPALRVVSTAPPETAEVKASATVQKVSAVQDPSAAPTAKVETVAKVPPTQERPPAASAPVPAPTAAAVSADSKSAEKHAQWPSERVPATLAPSTVVATAPAPTASVEAPATPLYWSAAAGASEAVAPATNEQGNVPPVLRGLRKCEACGFPISGGRVLCVECEEKKWRGQLKRPAGTSMPTGALPASQVRMAGVQAQGAAVGSAAATGGLRSAGAVSPKSVDVPVRAPQDSTRNASQPTAAKSVIRQPEPPRPQVGKASSPMFSGGLEPSQSWLARNKYVLGVLAAVAATIGAVVLLR
jgi:hypothetical protein